MNGSLESLFSTEFSTSAVGLQATLLGMLISFVTGHIIAWVYMWTHDGLSYSRAFTGSLLAMPVIVSLVMVLMAGNIFIAFGLIAVFTVVRFRNVLKDTRDTIFVLWAIVEGMAGGTQRFGLALIGAFAIAGVFMYLWLTAFGVRQRYDVVLNLQCRGVNGNGDCSAALHSILRRHSLRVQLASRRSPDGERQDLSYRLLLRDPSRGRDLVSELEGTEGVARVSLYQREEESEV